MKPILYDQWGKNGQGPSVRQRVTGQHEDYLVGLWSWSCNSRQDKQTSQSPMSPHWLTKLCSWLSCPAYTFRTFFGRHSSSDTSYSRGRLTIFLSVIPWYIPFKLILGSRLALAMLPTTKSPDDTNGGPGEWGSSCL